MTDSAAESQKPLLSQIRPHGLIKGQPVISLSVIICSHNPRSDHLMKALEALKGQTLHRDHWELVLVDNASKKRLDREWDLSWHPLSRHIREDRLGKTHALFTGIRQAQGELLTIVDDDNLLRSDYLENALRIAMEFPKIGAFGGGSTGEFESAVPLWAEPYLESLAVKQVERARWGNDYSWSDAVPFGAGMCVRRNVGVYYCMEAERDEIRSNLGPTGSQLTRADDLDLAWTAIDLGLGTGRFPELQIVHLIASDRLTQDYLVRLHAGLSFSNIVLWRVRGLTREKPRLTLRDLLRHWAAMVKLRGLRRRMYLASREATIAAWELLGRSDRLAH